jgi:hypothetical protein
VDGLRSFVLLLMDSQISLEELVTPTPVQNLYNLFGELVLLHRYFMAIDRMSFLDLERDKCANRLRSFLFPFNESMQIVLREMGSALRFARDYYTDNREELGGDDLINVQTEQDVQMFLDGISRRNQIDYSSLLLDSLEEAIPVLKDQALPLLPEIERELKEFVKNYQERHDATQKRAQSWVPSAVQNLVWGSLEPTTRDISKIKDLPEQLENGIRYLKKLPKFLEDLKDHLQRMTSLTRADYENLGYSSIEGFKRLYANRVQCSSLLSRMSMEAGSFSLAFIRGKLFKLDEDMTYSSKFCKDV